MAFGIKRNLTFKLILMLFMLFLSAEIALAQSTFTSNLSGASGNWSDPGSWINGGEGSSTYPGETDAGDIVVITGGDSVLLNVTPAQTIASLTVNSGSGTELDLNANTLTITGNVIINGDIDDGVGASILNIGGNFTINSGATFNGSGNGISVTFTGSGTIGGTYAGSSLEFNNFDINASGTITNSLTAGIIISGQFLMQSGTFDAGSAVYTLGYSILSGYTFDKSGGNFTANTSTLSIKATVNIRMRIDATTSFYAIEHAPPTGARTLSFDETAAGAANYIITNSLSLQPNSSGVAFLNEAAMVYSGATTTLSYTTNNSLTLGNEWATGSNAPKNVTINSSGTMTLGSSRTVDSTFTLTGGGTFNVTTGTFTVNGTLSKGLSTFTMGGTLVYGSSAILEYTASQTAAAEWPTTVPNVTIDDGVTATVNSGSARIISSNLTLSGTGSLTYTLPNTLTVSGNATIGTGTLSLSNASGNLNVGGNLDNNGSLTTSNGTIDVGGTLTNRFGKTIDAGSGAITVTGNLIGEASSTINTSTTVTINGNIIAASDVEIARDTGGEVIMGGSGDVTITNFVIVFDFTVNKTGGGSVTVNPGAQLRFDTGGTLDVNQGTLTLSQVGQILNDTGGSNISGVNLTISSTLQTGGTNISGMNSYSTSSGTIVFNGTSQETLPATTVDILTIANAAGAVTSGDITVNSTLNFTSGTITSTSANTLILDAGASASASGTSFVLGPVTRNTDGTENVFGFPIGFGTNLRQVSMTFGAVPAGGNTVTVEAKGTISSPTSTDPDVTSVEDDGSWTISSSLGSVAHTTTFNTTGFSPAINASSDVTILQGTSPAFNTEGTSPTPGSNTISGGFTGYGDFAVGNLAGAFVFDGESGANWSTPANWVGDVAPSNGDTVSIPGSFAVVYDGSVSTTEYGRVTLSGTSTLTLTAGTLNLSNTEIVLGATNQLTFNGTTISGFDGANTSYANGSTVSFNSGSVRVDDYSNLTIAGATGGTGTVNVAGNITINSGSFGGTIVLNGSVNQTITGSSVSFTNLTLDNSAGFTVSSATNVSGTLTLTDGIVENSSNLITTSGLGGGSSTSYISGPLARTNATGSKLFPIGDGSYKPVTSNLTGSGPTVSFEVIDGDAGGSFNTPLLAISVVRYYQGNISTGSVSGGSVTLSYDADDGVVEFNEAGDLVVARSAASNGEYFSLGGGTSGGIPGTVTSTITVGNALGYFLLGTTTGDNPLPVELLSFIADADYDKVTLNWQTASEIENLGFNIFRKQISEDQWQKVNDQMINGQGNTSIQTDYTFVDTKVKAGEKYSYKLESISYDGLINVEKVIDVEVLIPEKITIFNNYPNPFNPTTNIKFQLPEYSTINLSIYDLNGKLVKEILKNAAYDAGQFVVSWDATDMFENRVSSGMYLYRFSSGSFNKIGRMLLIK